MSFRLVITLITVISTSLTFGEETSGEAVMVPESGSESFVPCKTSLRFTDVTEIVGLARTGDSFSVAVADYDRNGWLDLAVSGHGQVYVYRNDGGYFTPVITGRSKFGFDHGFDCHGLSWFDYDGDGWLDLFISNGAYRGMGGEPNFILRNDRNGGFERVDLPDALAYPECGGRCMLPYDLDRDGQEDVILFGAFREGREGRIVYRRGEDWEIAKGTGIEKIHSSTIAPFGNSPEGYPRFLFRTAGADAGSVFDFVPGEGFVNRSEELGLMPGFHVQTVVPIDYNNNGLLDLYYVSGRNWTEASPRVVNDSELYVNLVGGIGDPVCLDVRFRAEGTLSLSLTRNGIPRFEIGLGAGEVPQQAQNAEFSVNDPRLKGEPQTDQMGVYLFRDGDDLVLRRIGMRASDWAAVSGMISADSIELISPREQPLPPFSNRLYENRGDRFVDVTEQAGAGCVAPGADVVVADFNNDGFMDLYILNGTDPYVNTPNRLLLNNGDGTFTDVTASTGTAGSSRGRSCGGVAFDFNNNGSLDLFFQNGNGPPQPHGRGPMQMFRNDGDNGNSCQVEVLGDDAALVVANTGGYLLAQLAGGMSDRFGYSRKPVHIGLGQADTTEVEVRWSSGKVTHHTVRAGEKLTLGVTEEGR